MPTEGGAQRERDPAAPALLAAAACGAVLPVQSRVNGVLSVEVGALPAATISFVTGLLVLTVLLAVPGIRRRAARVPTALRRGTLRWWQVLGGVGGGLFVAGQTYAVPLVGVTAFLIAVIGGQSISALLVDRFGLGPAPARPVAAGSLVSAALAVAGVALVATARAGVTPGPPRGPRWSCRCWSSSRPVPAPRCSRPSTGW